MRAYEGNEPYIFMSYAHKDSVEVFRLMEQLKQRGYRIWYDDGIEPGSEWPENIAQHLLKAHVFITCISENSMESMNCRREINFALSKNKPFLSIYLERTNVPPGMELQISAQQSILKYNYNDEKRFLDKIESCSYLSPCKESGFEGTSNETVLNEKLSEDINRNRKQFPSKSFITKLLVGGLIGVIILLLAFLTKLLFSPTVVPIGKDLNTYAEVEPTNNAGYTYIFTDGVPGETVFEDRVFKDITDESEIESFTPSRDGFTFSYWDRSTNFDSKTVIMSAVWNQGSTSTEHYLIAGSDTRYIDSLELAELTYDECQLAINEIYARHGRKFVTPSIQAYFNAQSWYTPTVEPEDFTDSMLSDIELVNVNTIIEYQESQGWR